ncbi:DUF6197 family protein [Planosporangium mesophilum]|nr:hypothetical protein [Planosporangium mesophilum]
MHPTDHQPAVTGVEQTPAQTLRGAALYLERHGWIQGDYYRPDATGPFPPACAVGAIRMAAFGSRITDDDCIAAEMRDHARAIDVLVDFLDLTDPPPWDTYGDPSPFTWNDVPGRTADEVTATMRGAADDWDRMHRGAE